MITKWFKDLCKSMILWQGNSNLNRLWPVTCVDGVERDISGYAYTPAPLTPASSATDSGIHLGSGTTTPTATDHCIESEVELEVTRISGTVTQSGDAYVLEVSLTATNAGSSPVTVSEIAHYGTVRVFTSDTGTSTSARQVMFDRTLLQSPITIPAGDAATLTYRVTAS